MKDSCDVCRWLAIKDAEPVLSPKPDVRVCRLDGYQVWPGWLCAGDRFERRPEGKAIPAWTGEVRQRKYDKEGC